MSKKTVSGNKEFTKSKIAIKEEMISNIGFIYCQYCGSSVSLIWENHHIIWRSEKPLHENLHNKANILHVCSFCHDRLHKYKGLRNLIVKQRELNLLFGNDVLDKYVSDEIKDKMLLVYTPF